MQENHIKKCLEGAAKYLVYDLPTEKGLIGAECTSPKLQSYYTLIENRYSLPPANCQRINGGPIELPMQFSQQFVYSSCFISSETENDLYSMLDRLAATREELPRTRPVDGVVFYGLDRVLFTSESPLRRYTNSIY